uniref:Microtubule crosslinking factor 2 n=1 Tax=Tetraodon nigroviridis TaxID=99883 RepID=H3D021_TETNG
EEYAREIEELRSENDYLKDEMEELRSEMLEMRDMYMEDDVYQLQELRQQLEQANKNCRILQYRLRKAERRSIRVAQTGQVDGELIRTLEQDVKVAKDVSIRLHSQLDSIEKKRSRLEQENEELRVRLQDLEVAKQVLQQELDKKCKQNSQKKRAARPLTRLTRNFVHREDSSDLKCQLHFAKEESALMCKKLTKLVKDSEAMKEELAKYRSLYGDVNASLTVEEVADSPHTREEIRVHLKLVEEEANLLSRRIVELEVENRGLRAEMEDMKAPQDGPQELSGVGGCPGAGVAVALGGGASSENVMELQRHLQFVEEEAELLRRSLIEMEEQNKLLMNEINRYKSDLPPPVSVLSDGAVLISTDAPAQDEELRVAKLQIGELSGKVKKLQYENRVLLSNLQRCDLASFHSPSSSSSLHLALETDAEAGDSVLRLHSPSQRKEPVGGENNTPEVKERRKTATDPTASLHGCLEGKDHNVLLAMRDQARLVSTAIQLLTSPESSCLHTSPSVCHKRGSGAGRPGQASEISELSDLVDRPLVAALTSRLQALHAHLQAFVEQPDQAVFSLHPFLRLILSLLSFLFAELAHARSSLITGTNQKQTFPPPACPLQCLPRWSVQHGGVSQRAGAEPARWNGNSTRADASKLAHSKWNELQEEHRKALLRRDFQVQSLGLQARLQQKLWSQERTLLVQESQHLKQTLLLLSLKLRCFLKQWRLGCKKDTEWKDILEMNSLKDLYLLLEEENLAAADEQASSPTIKTPPCFLLQTSAVSSTLADLRMALQDLSGELRQELQGSQELTQQFAKAKASWEVERNGLKSLIAQLETKTGKAAASLSAGEAPEPADLKVALKREREEHQHLLAESYAAVMDLTKQLQIGERNWGREKLELLERFSQERAQWEQRLREATSQQGMVIPERRSEIRSDALMRSKLHVTKSIFADPDCNCTTLTIQDTQTFETQFVGHCSSSSFLCLSLLFLPVHDATPLPLDCTGAPAHSPELAVFKVDSIEFLGVFLNFNFFFCLKSKPLSGESSADIAITNGVSSPRMLNSPIFNRKSNQKKTPIAFPPLPICPETSNDSKKNWTYLTNQVFSGFSRSLSPHSFCPRPPKRSFTAPDRTGIRIYYSPPAVRRMEQRSIDGTGTWEAQQPALAFSSSYEQWLSSLSRQHRELLESRSGCVAGPVSTIADNCVAGSASSLVDGMPPSPAFHSLEMGEISANLSDDMKEMTNCVRQAIRSSSLERTSTKESGSQVESTQTASQNVSVGLQTDLSSSRGVAFHTKAWSPRPSSTTTSPLASARTRQISTSLDKVHARIERPCCSPKYGSPKLQRRVSSGTAAFGAFSSEPWVGERGCAWARSTTTRDSPVLSGLTDGLSSLFSVVEHS